VAVDTNGAPRNIDEGHARSRDARPREQ
jgi:hypothetical protein